MECPEHLMNNFKLFPRLLEDFPNTEYIPVSINSKTFEKMLSFAHTGDIPDAPDDLWCVSEKKYAELKELCMAADYLEYTELFETICKLVASSFVGKSKEEIEKIMNL